MDISQIDDGVTYSSAVMAQMLLASVQQVIADLPDERQTAAIGFMVTLIGSYTPYVMLEPENLAEISGLVFGNDDIRDFILTTKAVFFMNWLQGRSQDAITNLIRDMSYAISCDMGYTNENLAAHNSIEQGLYETLSKQGEAMLVLQANTWMVVVLMIRLFLQLKDLGLTKSKTK